MKASEFKQAAREARDRHARGDATDDDLRLLKHAEREGIDLNAPGEDDDREVTSWDGTSTEASQQPEQPSDEPGARRPRKAAQSAASASKQGKGSAQESGTAQQGTTNGPVTGEGRAPSEPGLAADSAG